MTDTLVSIAPGCWIDPASVESIEVESGTWAYPPDYRGIRVATHGGRFHFHAGTLGTGDRGTKYVDQADAIIDADKLAELLGKSFDWPTQ